MLAYTQSSTYCISGMLVGVPERPFVPAALGQCQAWWRRLHWSLLWAALMDMKLTADPAVLREHLNQWQKGLFTHSPGSFGRKAKYVPNTVFFKINISTSWPWIRFRSHFMFPLTDLLQNFNEDFYLIYDQIHQPPCTIFFTLQSKC